MNRRLLPVAVEKNGHQTHHRLHANGRTVAHRVRRSHRATPRSPSDQIQWLIEISKRSLPGLKPYLWTVIFIATILSFMSSLRLDWRIASFGTLAIVQFVVLLFIVNQVIRSGQTHAKRVTPFLLWSATIIGVAFASLSFSSVFFDWPLRFRPTPVAYEDAGAKTIRQFFKLIDMGKMEDVWTLIHSARKAEVSGIGIRNAQDFAKTYATTRQHTHMVIEKVQDTPGLGRAYRVAFDVRDDFPRSHLYDVYASGEGSVKAWFNGGNGGALEKQRLLDIVMDDVRAAFEVPKSLEPKIVQYVDQLTFESLFRPELIAEIGRQLDLVRKKSFRDSLVPIWRHLILRVELQEEGPGSWKIRRGLYPRLVEGIYRSSLVVP